VKPTSPSDRILEVDVLRGLAVLGMVIWDFRSGSMGNFHVGGALDSYVNGVVAVSDIQDTVHLIFALLFGWGLAQGLGDSKLSLRRLASLLIMGMVTASLLDRTDFLHYLAIMGVVLLLFKDLSNRAVVTLAVVMVAAPVLAARFLTRTLSPEAYGGSHLWDSLGPSFIQSASYGQMVVTRGREALLDLLHPKVYVENLDMLVAFLLGLYARRRGVLRDIPAHLGLIVRTLWISLAVHLVGVGWSILRLQTPYTANVMVGEYSKQAFAVFYVCLVVVLLRARIWRRILGQLAPVGRLALSAYLLHCFIGTTLFFGYGLGLYGRLGMAAGEALAVATCAVIMVLSSWWLSRFELGPAEWAWRAVTYWRLPRLVPPALPR
jgi:uncharacterized protein